LALSARSSVAWLPETSLGKKPVEQTTVDGRRLDPAVLAHEPCHIALAEPAGRYDGNALLSGHFVDEHHMLS
jgi:hypothetical protein